MSNGFAGFWRDGAIVKPTIEHADPNGNVVIKDWFDQYDTVDYEWLHMDRVLWLDTVATPQTPEQEKDILHLNRMLRETGYGQGQIDAYAAICEENDRLKQQVALQNKDWCEEDDAVKQLVRGILLDEQIDGDSYGMPGVVNIVEMLVDEIKMLKNIVAGY